MVCCGVPLTTARVGDSVKAVTTYGKLTRAYNGANSLPISRL